MRQGLVLAVFALSFTFLTCMGGGGNQVQSTTSQSSSIISEGVSNFVLPPPTSSQFTVAVIPDSQCYTSKGGIDEPLACGQDSGPATLQMLVDQFNWITTNRDTMKISAVIGVGDIVNCGGTDWEWSDANTAYKILEDQNIPYLPVLGNHDYDVSCVGNYGNRANQKFNAAFPVSRFAAHSWFGTSTYPASQMDNFYAEFSVDSEKYLVLALELFPRDAALAWAQTVIDSHPDSNVIVTTHAYLLQDGSRYGANDIQGPAGMQLVGYNDGQHLWDKFLKKNRNIIAVVSGHLTGAVNRTDAGDNGNQVVQIQADYQGFARGGAGYFRLLRIDSTKREITAFTCSPSLGKYLVDPANYFTVHY